MMAPLFVGPFGNWPHEELDDRTGNPLSAWGRPGGGTFCFPARKQGTGPTFPMFCGGNKCYCSCSVSWTFPRIAGPKAYLLSFIPVGKQHARAFFPVVGSVSRRVPARSLRRGRRLLQRMMGKQTGSSQSTVDKVLHQLGWMI